MNRLLNVTNTYKLLLWNIVREYKIQPLKTKSTKNAFFLFYVFLLSFKTMYIPFNDYKDFLIEEGTIDDFDYVILHNAAGYRCGYVKVNLNHPWFGKSYVDIKVEVHGGVTLSAPDIEDVQKYWVGFDCSHCFDAPDPTLCGNIPDWLLEGRRGNDIRSTDYVREEINKLICQAELAYSEK